TDEQHTGLDQQLPLGFGSKFVPQSEGSSYQRQVRRTFDNRRTDHSRLPVRGALLVWRVELVNPDGADGTPRERPKPATAQGAETDDDDLAVVARLHHRAWWWTAVRPRKLAYMIFVSVSRMATEAAMNVAAIDAGLDWR